MAVPIIPLLGLAAQFAPGLLRAVGAGKQAEVLDKVASVTREIVGTDDPSEASRLLEEDPELAIRYREALIAAEVETDKMYLADKQDARARDVEIRRMGGENTRGDILAYAAVAGFFAVLAAMFFVEIPEGSPRDALLILLGTLAGVVTQLFDFEFGSSKGSKEKDKIR